MARAAGAGGLLGRAEWHEQRAREAPHEAREHEEAAAGLRFMAGHLFAKRLYSLSEADLHRLGVLR